jgi:Putative prokaryotic signal transducing protein
LRVDLDDFRRRYAELSDEALLELDRDELVDLARDCYDAELARRGLRRSSPPATEAQDHGELVEGELVEVAIFSSSSEADLARALLESAAIPCYLENESAGKTLRVTDGLRLFVPATLLENAREVLETPVSDEELAAQAEAEPAPSSESEELD